MGSMSDIFQIWNYYTHSKSSYRERELLIELCKKYSLETLEYALKQLLAINYYPTVKLFINYVQEHEEEFPDSLLCAAYLSGSSQVIEWADELRALNEAWFPTPESFNRALNLQERLKAVLGEH